MAIYTESNAARQFQDLTRELEGNRNCRIHVLERFPNSPVPSALRVEMLGTSLAQNASGNRGDAESFHLEKRWWNFGVGLAHVPHFVAVIPLDPDFAHPQSLSFIGICLTGGKERPHPPLATIIRRLYLTLTFQLLDLRDCMRDQPALARFIQEGLTNGSLPTDRGALDVHGPRPAVETCESADVLVEPVEIVEEVA